MRAPRGHRSPILIGSLVLGSCSPAGAWPDHVYRGDDLRRCVVFRLEEIALE